MACALGAVEAMVSITTTSDPATSETVVDCVTSPGVTRPSSFFETAVAVALLRNTDSWLITFRSRELASVLPDAGEPISSCACAL
jgi:hypothetical protein